MGAFFSLHEAREWKAAVEGMTAPSIWSHASFSPLNRENKILLERPGRVEYDFPRGIRQGDDFIHVAPGSEVSLMVCFEEKAGRVYSALLVTAPKNKTHCYRRAQHQVSLEVPGGASMASMQSTSHMASQQSLGGLKGGTLTIGSRASLSSVGGGSSSAVASAVTVQNVNYERLVMDHGLLEAFCEEVQAAVAAQVGAEILPEHVIVEVAAASDLRLDEETRPDSTLVEIAILPPAGVKASVVMAALPGRAQEEHPLGAVVVSCCGRVAGFDAVCTGAPAVAVWRASPQSEGVPAVAPASLHLDSYRRSHNYWMAAHKRTGPAGLAAKNASTLGDTEQLSADLGLADDKDVEDVPWTHLLLYSVKEGVLVYFANDQESCEEVIREIATAYSVAPPGRVDVPVQVGTGTPSQIHAGISSVSSQAAAAARLTLICHKLGHAKTICCRQFCDVIVHDLARRFQISGYEAEEVGNVTNCVLFCLRNMREMQLPMRGNVIQSICRQHPQLGVSVGDVAASLWETMWVQCGQTGPIAGLETKNRSSLSKVFQDEQAGEKAVMTETLVMAKTRFQDWQASGAAIGPRPPPH